MQPLIHKNLFLLTQYLTEDKPSQLSKIRRRQDWTSRMRTALVALLAPSTPKRLPKMPNAHKKPPAAARSSGVGDAIAITELTASCGTWCKSLSLHDDVKLWLLFSDFSLARDSSRLDDHVPTLNRNLHLDSGL